MSPDFQDALITLLVRQADHLATADEMVEWATAALAKGMETPALVILAGLPRGSSLSEADPWFQQALVQLNLSGLSPVALRRAYLGVVSRAVLAQTLDHREALDLVHRHVMNPLNHPGDLMAWCHLWEGNHPADFHDLKEQEAETETRTLARQWATQLAFMAEESGT